MSNSMTWISNQIQTFRKPEGRSIFSSASLQLGNTLLCSHCTDFSDAYNMAYASSPNDILWAEGYNKIVKCKLLHWLSNLNAPVDYESVITVAETKSGKKKTAFHHNLINSFKIGIEQYAIATKGPSPTVTLWTWIGNHKVKNSNLIYSKYCLKQPPRSQHHNCSTI